jgi:sortase (surface protein transpeptidase)
MKILRSMALLSLLAGLSLLLVGLACSDDELSSQPKAEETATPTNTATPTATSTPTATPTPMPFDGAVSRIKIPRFKVDSAIEAIGLLPNNQLDIPANPHNTGWYDIYDKPGFGGNALLSAHVDYFPNIIGPFKNLYNLAEGDEVIIVMENGEEYVYRFLRKERYPVNTIPMGELISAPSRPEGKEWITLITCGGEFRVTGAGGVGEYLHRDVVIAERIK